MGVLHTTHFYHFWLSDWAVDLTIVCSLILFDLPVKINLSLGRKKTHSSLIDRIAQFQKENDNNNDKYINV